MRYALKPILILTVLLSFFLPPSPRGFSQVQISYATGNECLIYIHVHKEIVFMDSTELDRKIAELEKRIRSLGHLLRPGPIGQAMDWIGSFFVDLSARQDGLMNELIERRRQLREYKKAKQEMRNHSGDYTYEEVGRMMADWKKEIEDIWNGGGRTFECCAVKFVVSIRQRERNENPTDGYDQITVMPDTWFRSFIRAAFNFDEDGFSNTPYEKSVTGAWAFSKHAKEKAHEAGHELGLKDRYKDKVQADGSIKSEPDDHHKRDLMATLDGAPRPEDIRKILRKRGVACSLRCCAPDRRAPPDPADTPAGTDIRAGGDATGAAHTPDAASSSAPDPISSTVSDAHRPGSRDPSKTSTGDTLKPASGDLTSTSTGDNATSTSGDPIGTGTPTGNLIGTPSGDRTSTGGGTGSGDTTTTGGFDGGGIAIGGTGAPTGGGTLGGHDTSSAGGESGGDNHPSGSNSFGDFVGINNSNSSNSNIDTVAIGFQYTETQQHEDYDSFSSS